MATDRPYYRSSDLSRDLTQGEGLNGLPTISTGLNAVRTYSFEIDFTLPPGVL